ncbi:MAG: hypothetical protein IPJ88_11445 [Myxococcales bacterium]|nr:MAG: hypothetical protein IPJ88_11445 [Myxococcales bacterium]
MHDIVWAAAPFFRSTETKIGRIKVILSAPPGYGDTVRLQLALLKKALPFFEKSYGAYPYATLKVIIPPRSGDGVAAMEYPALFVSSGPWFVKGIFAAYPALVTVHELAHQWFYGIVASNEVEYAFLDEGLSEWSSLNFLQMLSKTSSPLLPSSLHHIDPFDHLTSLLSHALDATLPVSEYCQSDYAASVYSKTAATLETIKRIWGSEHLIKTLGHYARNFRFMHPTPDALYAMFDEHYWPGFSKTIFRPLLRSQTAIDFRLRHVHSTRIGQQWHSEIYLSTNSPIPLPLWLSILHENGKTSRLALRFESGAIHLSHQSTSPIRRVVLDSERSIVVDANPGNQQWPKSTVEKTQWFSKLLYAGQLLLGMVGP